MYFQPAESAALSPAADARQKPHTIALRVFDRGDHFVPAIPDLLARLPAMLGDRVGVAVAPGGPDVGKHLARHAQRVDHDVVAAHILEAALEQKSWCLAANAQVR